MTPEITYVPSEKAHPQIAGSIFPGSDVRIMMRSPTAVVFNGLGCNYWNRDEHAGWHGLKKLFSDRPTIARFEAAQEKVDALYGEGVGAALIHAWRKNLTVLLDGGGKPLPPTRMKARAMHKEAYAKVTINWEADLTGEVKTCRQCSKPLRLSTDHHRFEHTIEANHPRSVEDCQRLTNRRVVAIHDYGDTDRDRVGYVRYFETWDGESYLEEDFCGDTCAAVYGRRAVRERPLLDPGGAAYKHPYRPRNDVQLGTKVERTFTLNDGRTIKA